LAYAVLNNEELLSKYTAVCESVWGEVNTKHSLAYAFSDTGDIHRASKLFNVSSDSPDPDTSKMLNTFKCVIDWLCIHSQTGIRESDSIYEYSETMRVFGWKTGNWKDFKSNQGFRLCGTESGHIKIISGCSQIMP